MNSIARYAIPLALRRDILFMLVWKDIRIKYKQSIMGYLWAILMPLIIISSGMLVKFGMAKYAGKPMLLTDIVTVAIKALPWSFFVASLRFATNSLVANENLVTKIRFPREILPISAVLSQLVDLLIASSLIVVLLFVVKSGVSTHMLWIPVFIAILVLFTVSLGLIMAAANLFYRDVKYIVEVILTFAIFFTPVFYDAKIAGEWEWVLLLNPVAPLLEGINQVIVFQCGPELPWICYSAVSSLGTAALSMIIFKKLEPKFAERI